MNEHNDILNQLIEMQKQQITINNTQLAKSDKTLDAVGAIASTVNDMKSEMKVFRDEIASLKKDMPIDANQRYRIKKAMDAQVVSVINDAGLKKSKKVTSKAYSKMWGKFRDYFEIPQYSSLPKEKFDEAIGLIPTLKLNQDDFID